MKHAPDPEQRLSKPQRVAHSRHTRTRSRTTGSIRVRLQTTTGSDTARFDFQTSSSPASIASPSWLHDDTRHFSCPIRREGSGVHKIINLAVTISCAVFFLLVPQSHLENIRHRRAIATILSQNDLRGEEDRREQVSVGLAPARRDRRAHATHHPETAWGQR